MTNDDDKDALEAAKKARWETGEWCGDSVEQFEAGWYAYHAAMTEGGVWISREDARYIVTMADYTRIVRTAVAGDTFAEKEVCDRLRSKLDGNHDT